MNISSQEIQITIDQNSGFCFGVVYAIQMAEDFLEQNDLLYCLGDIVHNDEEVDRLKKKGLSIINHEELKNLKNATVLIRAHGEPPDTYRIAMENSLTLIDASCPVVLKLQNRVRKAYDKSHQIVIYGQKGHAEVNGLVGQTGGDAIVITNPEEINDLDFNKPIELFSQTTKSSDKFKSISQQIQTKISDSEEDNDFKMNDTICRQVSNREPLLERFSQEYDVIIFVSGKKSSNGKVLYNVCKSHNDNSYFVSSKDELLPEWFQEIESVGICGATSTPMWLMEEVRDAIILIRNN